MNGPWSVCTSGVGDAVGHRERGVAAVVVDDVERAPASGRRVDRGERARDVVGLELRLVDLVRVRRSSSVTTSARESEPGAANSVTSWPRATRPSHSSRTTSSIPPYAGAGTGIHGGASIAMRSARRAVRTLTRRATARVHPVRSGTETR